MKAKEMRSQIKSSLSKIINEYETIDKIIAEFPHRKELISRCLKLGQGNSQYIFHSKKNMFAAYENNKGDKYEIEIRRSK